MNDSRYGRSLLRLLHIGVVALATVLGLLARPDFVAAATPTSQSLEARIGRIDDRMAIGQLLMEYGRG